MSEHLADDADKPLNELAADELLNELAADVLKAARACGTGEPVAVRQAAAAALARGLHRLLWGRGAAGGEKALAALVRRLDAVLDAEHQAALNELARQSALAADAYLADEAALNEERRAALLELAERQAEALNELGLNRG